MSMTIEADARHDVAVEDVEYQRQGGRALLARLYRPSGAGPFPAALQIHGGAWVNKDRTDNDFMARALAESGILVASIDFRMPPEAPYPASLADINLATRWLKARAGQYQEPRRMGRQLWHVERRASGVAGGNAARRPALCGLAARRSAADGCAAGLCDLGLGCARPAAALRARQKGRQCRAPGKPPQFLGRRGGDGRGNPPRMLERGEKVHLPPALVFGGDRDEWVPVELMRKFAADYRKAGGEAELQLYEGANHGFMTGKPDAPYAARALDRMKAFIRKHTSG